ncbi:hypothetical protein SAMN05216563_12513 [Phytobacter palmae]|nr:hypothetical protein SAMN05216563_12513 [Phytobacter palmae]
MLVNLLGGVSIILTTLIGFIGKLYFEKFKSRQDALNKQLQASIDAANSALKSKHESSVYVTKSQFDKEFSSYSSIWGAAFELKECVMELRPMLDFTDENESFEKRKERRLLKFKEAFNAFVIHSESNKPFLPLEVYERIELFRVECRKESILYHYGDPDRPVEEYWNVAEKNRKIISELFDEICEAIRQRLHALSVIE